MSFGYGHGPADDRPSNDLMANCERRRKPGNQSALQQSRLSRVAVRAKNFVTNNLRELPGGDRRED
jgi:hypothetical protein